MSKARFIIVEIALLLFSAATIGRLFYWQVLNYQDFAATAKAQVESTVSIGAKRGKIFSSDGSILVSNQKAYLMYALLPEILKIKDKDETYSQLINDISDQLVPILVRQKVADNAKTTQPEIDLYRDETKSKMIFQLGRTGVVWVPLAKKITEQTKLEVEKLKIKGIGFEEDTKRFYPEGNLAANLLGFVGEDRNSNDKGYSGWEGCYDSKLRGHAGNLIQEVDASGRPILADTPEGLGALDGLDCHTTIDRTVQFVVDSKLSWGVQKYGARAGAAIIINPKTGALLASSSFPSFDLLDPASSKTESYKNYSISEVFEPGSIYKAVTFSAALDSGSIKIDTICPCAGPIKVSGYEMQTFNNKYYPNSTITQILQRSDNVGAAFAAQKMGTDIFLKYIQDFAFGVPTAIDLQGEESGIIKGRSDWHELDLVNAAFGQGLSVTAMQMVSAFAAIGNDGVLMKPFVVKKIVGADEEVEFKSKQVKRVIKSSTATIMKELLFAAVEGGEAKKLIPHGYRVAGKTGTAQVPIPGGYSTKTVASFVGFGPVEDPRFAMIIVLFQPSASIYAAETSEPLFFDIIKALYPYWGVPVHE